MANFTLPRVPYSYDALEPHIDARTMEIHHTKHHQAYTDGLNKALGGLGPEWQNKNDIVEILKDIDSVPESARSAGSFNDFKDKFSKDAVAIQGSGWGWLVYNQNASGVQFITMPNQTSPWTKWKTEKVIPLLGIDVWEHAYYLKYQNRRADYVAAWWNVVNWDGVKGNFQQALRS